MFELGLICTLAIANFLKILKSQELIPLLLIAVSKKLSWL